MNKIGLLWRTVRHLQRRQVVYQLVNRCRTKPRLRWPNAVPKGYFLAFPEADKPVSYTNQTFTFLGLSAHFPDAVQWNYPEHGKLWTYTLNYFDYLNQPGLSPQEGLRLIVDFMGQTNSLVDGLEPYPTSLRIMNWVQFLCRHQIQDNSVNSHLFAQVQLLRRRLEYHLAGNHLLENSFALLMGALYFRHQPWLQTASALLLGELSSQVLPDGAHEERSPVYHQLLLDRLLNVLMALRADNWHKEYPCLSGVEETARRMLAWLNGVTFANGDVPMVNDAAWGMAPTTAQLFRKATQIGLEMPEKTASTIGQASGYRMFRQPRYELLADVGLIGPDHQPGHGHADTFSFILHVDGQPVLADSGTSTYQTGPRRAWERSTAAHNTVVVDGKNSSEVWSSFRVGRRARVGLLVDQETALSAWHTGYQSIGLTHERTWLIKPTEISLRDRLTGRSWNSLIPERGVARFYFHPALPVALFPDHARAGPVVLTFSSDSRLSLSLQSYEMASGFNQLRPALCLVVGFNRSLDTEITLVS